MNENERLISQLPDEIVLSSILSWLTIKEVARTRLVSRHWNCSWHHISVLNFDNSSVVEKIKSEGLVKFWTYGRLIVQERSSFVYWVNQILGKHKGSVIDQFNVTFDLDNSYQSDIDSWVVLALTKHVKKLELDFNLASYYHQEGSEHNRYVLHQPLLEYCYCTLKVKPFLTSLCLKCVNVTSQAVEQLLESCCSTLENLYIEKSEHLTSIKACGSTSSLQSLKYFAVFRCNNLETIDISGPKLLSFKYHGYPLRLLHIANASSLSQVSINVNREDRLVDALSSLYNYFSQLEYLKLRWYLYPDINFVINDCPVLTNLKHLELWANGCGDRTLSRWIPLIKACPLLQKLTLQVPCVYVSRSENVVKCDRHPLWCLKTLELIDFDDYNVGLDVVNFVLENGVVLQEVFVRPSQLINLKLLCGALNLKVPRNVKLIFI